MHTETASTKGRQDFERWQASLLASGGRAAYSAHLTVQTRRDYATKILNNAPPEFLWVRMVRHLNHYYFVVFRDGHYNFITDVWIRDTKAAAQRSCVWAHAWRINPSPRILNICRKALEQVMGELVEEERAKPKGEQVQPSLEHPPANI